MLDEKDSKILELLKESAKLTTKQISKKTGIPATTVHNRIKRMEKTGIIRKYTVNINDKKIGKNISAYILLTVDYKMLKQLKITQHDVAKKLRLQEPVQRVDVITGTYDMILRVTATDIEQLNEFIIKYLRNMDGIGKTETLVILSKF
jgi:Lrp/AsnC family leucine-responsive transcriptional regulator